MRIQIVTTLALLAAAAPLPAQLPQVIQRASLLVNTGRATEAIPALDSLTKASPEVPQGWGLLGTALIATGQFERAVPVLRKAITFPGPRPNALYNLGIALARLGQVDSAMIRLREARATGQVDMTRLISDSNGTAIRARAGYAALVPTAAEFAAPFAEAVPMLREWQGDQAGDQFGWVARDAGDVDGDGVHDIVTSSPSARGGAGTVYLLSTAKGTRLWSVSGTNPKDALGTTAEAAGDANGDGIPDVIAAAPGGNYALILSGRDGHILHRLEKRTDGEQFGLRASDLGDIDGDRQADVMVAATMTDSAGSVTGRVHVISGKTGRDIFVLTGHPGEQFGSALGGAVHSGQSLVVIGAGGAPNGGRVYVYRGRSTSPAFTIEPDSTSAGLGSMFLSVVGDIDADGTPDVYASDWSNSAKGPTTGRVYLHSGATGKRLYTLTGEGPGNGFGIGVADAGDVDRDGADDLVIGAWIYPGLAASGGKVYLHSGRDGHLLGQLTGRVMGETLGFDATGIGDVDGDLVPDLLLTSAWSGVKGTRSGRVFVVSGAAMLRTLATPLPTGGSPSPGPAPRPAS